jgi:hypothetical protein
MMCNYARRMTSADRGRSARDNDRSVGGIHDEIAYAGSTRSLTTKSYSLQHEIVCSCKVKVVPVLKSFAVQWRFMRDWRYSSKNS